MWSILLVSDIHGHEENVCKLKEELRKQCRAEYREILLFDGTRIEMTETLKTSLHICNREFDLILVLGDIADIPSGCTEDKEFCEESHSVITNILTELAQINAKVYFIPGNHDSSHLFSGWSVRPKEGSVSPLNLHGTVIPLEENLFVGGVGGSVSATQNGEVVWDGTPWQEDNHFGQQCDLVIEKMREMSSGKGQGILVTHSGPKHSGTSDKKFPIEETIEAGSQSLASTLQDNQAQDMLISNVHGHTHYAIGCDHIGKIRTINPGALKHGCYGVMKVAKLPDANDDMKWQLVSVEFHRLIPSQHDEII